MAEAEAIEPRPSRKRERVLFSEQELKTTFDRILTENNGFLNVDEFARMVVALDIDIGDVEARRMFSWIDLQHEGLISFNAFCDAMRHNSFFRMLVVKQHTDDDFAVSSDYDFNVDTYSRYRHPSYVVQNKFGTGSTKLWDAAVHGSLSGSYTHARSRVDYAWHTNYTQQRTEWQDSTIAGVVSRDRNDDAIGQSWILFTAGAMGAGKGYAMRWLSKHGIVELEQLVRIDPDYFKRKMPEWSGYVDANRETAGSSCHKESGLMQLLMSHSVLMYWDGTQEIAQEIALQSNSNVWVDGSLGDHGWFTQVFADIRSRYPHYRIAIFYVYCSEDEVLARAAKRGQETGRVVPVEILRDSLEKTKQSLQVLGPQADFLAVINNEDPVPKLDRVEDRTKSFQAIASRFSLGQPKGFPEALAAIRVNPAHADMPQHFSSEMKDWFKQHCNWELASSTCGSNNVSLPLPPSVYRVVSEASGMTLAAASEYQLIFSPVELDRDSRQHAGIPAAATHHSYCFGAVSRASNSRLCCSATSANPGMTSVLSLMESGGFIYFDQQGALIDAMLCANKQIHNDGSTELTKTITFGKPITLSKTFKRYISAKDRWVPTAFGHVRAGGANSFTWIVPNEIPFAPFGGFIYRFKGSPNLLFPRTPQ